MGETMIDVKNLSTQQIEFQLEWAMAEMNRRKSSLVSNNETQSSDLKVRALMKRLEVVEGALISSEIRINNLEKEFSLLKEEQNKTVGWAQGLFSGLSNKINSVEKEVNNPMHQQSNVIRKQTTAKK